MTYISWHTVMPVDVLLTWMQCLCPTFNELPAFVLPARRLRGHDVYGWLGRPVHRSNPFITFRKNKSMRRKYLTNQSAKGPMRQKYHSQTTKYAKNSILGKRLK